MSRNSGFWILLAVFQLAFGLAVFGATRYYYIQDEGATGTASSSDRNPLSSQGASGLQLPGSAAQIDAATFTGLGDDDPSAISRQADEFFRNRQYDRAAELYQRLQQLAPNNVENLNNLGLTLHYLGRSSEALTWLNQGTALDPSHQRIWLTLGYVYSQVGNTIDARRALTEAVALNADNEIGRSASDMRENLP